jgi:hypothetical protein
MNGNSIQAWVVERIGNRAGVSSSALTRRLHRRRPASIEDQDQDSPLLLAIQAIVAIGSIVALLAGIIL